MAFFKHLKHSFSSFQSLFKKRKGQSLESSTSQQSDQEDQISPTGRTHSFIRTDTARLPITPPTQRDLSPSQRSRGFQDFKRSECPKTPLVARIPLDQRSPFLNVPPSQDSNTPSSTQSSSSKYHFRIQKVSAVERGCRDQSQPCMQVSVTDSTGDPTDITNSRPARKDTTKHGGQHSQPNAIDNRLDFDDRSATHYVGSRFHKFDKSKTSARNKIPLSATERSQREEAISRVKFHDTNTLSCPACVQESSLSSSGHQESLESVLQKTSLPFSDQQSQACAFHRQEHLRSFNQRELSAPSYPSTSYQPKDGDRDSSQSDLGNSSLDEQVEDMVNKLKAQTRSHRRSRSRSRRCRLRESRETRPGLVQPTFAIMQPLPLGMRETDSDDSNTSLREQHTPMFPLSAHSPPSHHRSNSSFLSAVGSDPAVPAVTLTLGESQSEGQEQRARREEEEWQDWDDVDSGGHNGNTSQGQEGPGANQPTNYGPEEFVLDLLLALCRGTWSDIL